MSWLRRKFRLVMVDGHIVGQDQYLVLCPHGPVPAEALHAMASQIPDGLRGRVLIAADSSAFVVERAW